MSSESTLELIKQRRSVRAFLDKPVSQEILETVFSSAQHSPSNCNTQPWHIAVVSGDKCNDLREKFFKAFTRGEMSMDFPYDGVYEGAYKTRQYGAAAALYGALGIAREDKAARQQQFTENFKFFGAPHVAFLFLPEKFGMREAADLGMYAQTLMLSMAAQGIASCPQTALSFFADLLRKELNIDSSFKLLFGISFGYEDTEHPVNRCRTDRATLNEAVEFYS